MSASGVVVMFSYCASGMEKDIGVCFTTVLNCVYVYLYLYVKMFIYMCTYICTYHSEQNIDKFVYNNTCAEVGLS